MVLTPTYYVFKMFKEHQNNMLLGSFITSDTIESKEAKRSCPMLIESASIDENGVIYSTIANVSIKSRLKLNAKLPTERLKALKRKFFAVIYMIKTILKMPIMLKLKNLLISGS